MRLLLEVLADIRSKVGNDFPIHLRLSGYERESGGREYNETAKMAPVLVDAGVSAFHVSGGVGDANITQIIPSTEYPPGFNVNPASMIKDVVDVPVMAVGRNSDVFAAEQLLEQGNLDLVVFGRAIFADPHLPNKASAGNVSQIRPCNVCQDCVDTIMRGGGSACALNPNSGRELQLPPDKKADTPMNLLVVGGGVAGMEAARIAAGQGHSVTLWEKSGELGGNFVLAANLLADHQPYLDWLRSEVSRLPVTVELNREVGAEDILDFGADKVIVATGGSNQPLSYKGDEQAHVLSGAALHKEIASGLTGLKNDEDVIVLGGNVMATELIDAIARKRQQQNLAPQSHSLILVNEQNRLADGAGKKRRGDVSRRLDQHGVHVLTGVKVLEITANQVVVELENGNARHLPADRVLVADQMNEDRSFIEQLEPISDTVVCIGDCAGEGLVKKAILDAANAIYSL
jgi:2,4-dienoyl-CoA reductase (NADPH2)